jgi:hypothetical protein
LADAEDAPAIVISGKQNSAVRRGCKARLVLLFIIFIILLLIF